MEQDTNTTKDADVLQERTKEWMSGAGGSLAVQTTFSMLNNLYKLHGQDFTIAGSLDALDKLAEIAQAVKRDLQKQVSPK